MFKKIKTEHAPSEHTLSKQQPQAEFHLSYKIPDIIYKHTFEFVRSGDHLYDYGHRSLHCLTVAANILDIVDETYDVMSCANTIDKETVRKMLVIGALCHEQFDVKRAEPCIVEEMCLAWTRDDFHLHDELIYCLQNCSFSKMSGDMREKSQKVHPFNPILRAIREADIIEAVTQNGIQRSYEYHRYKMYGPISDVETETIPASVGCNLDTENYSYKMNDPKCWQQVYGFYRNDEVGLLPRIKAVKSAVLNQKYAKQIAMCIAQFERVVWSDVK